MTDWIQTYSGKKITIRHSEDNEYTLIDIAHALSLQSRFVGHTEKLYSVAQHSVIVSQVMPPQTPIKTKLIALLHDASEAYLGNVSRPLKRFLIHYRDIEEAMQAGIYKYYDLEPTAEELEMVKFYDNCVLAIEYKQLMQQVQTLYWNVLDPPTVLTNIIIMPVPSDQACLLFKREYNSLINKLN